jgi:hypothetical protein
MAADEIDPPRPAGEDLPSDPRGFRALWPEFLGPSWAGWASIEDAVFGLEPANPGLFARVTGDRAPPTEPVSEVWAIVGRGGGKSRWAARMAAYFATARAYRRAPGERIYCGIFAPDRRQSKVTLSYVSGLLHEVPTLERLIEREQRESIELSHGTTVEVITASKAAPRGRSYALAIIEEAAFLPQDSSSDPDTELLRALRPALSRVEGSMLVVISSPYARKGELWRAWERYYGKDSPSSLVVQADTLTLNPRFDVREIERARFEDPASAAAEYGAEFRRDVESFVAREVVEAAIADGCRERPPRPGIDYRAFVDPSGGSVDSFTLAIGHAEVRGGQPVAVLDALREQRPPFSPESTVEEFAALLRTYGVRHVEGDRYAGEWPREAFRRYGIEYEPAGAPKSDLYRDALAVLNAGRVELLDHERLKTQLVGLERKTARGGRDSIDHPPGGHDDVANVACGLACRLAVVPPKKQPRKIRLVAGRRVLRR